MTGAFVAGDDSGAAAAPHTPCLDPVPQESYESFVALFEHNRDLQQTAVAQHARGLDATPWTPAAAASAAAPAPQHPPACAPPAGAAAPGAAGPSRPAEDGLECVDIDAGVSPSILDSGAAELQSRVQFDNFVGTDDPDDVSDASGAAWEDVTVPAGTQPWARPQQPPAPRHQDPAPAAAPLPPRGATLDDDESSDDAADIAAFLAKRAPAPTPQRQLTPASPAKPPAPAAPGSPPGAAAAAAPWRGRPQLAPLPPGWAVDCATAKAVPPFGEAAAEPLDEREHVQRLHSELAATGGEDRPLTDADLYAEHLAEGRRRRERELLRGSGDEFSAERAAADLALFDGLHVPQQDASPHARAYEAARRQAAEDRFLSRQDEEGGAAGQDAEGGRGEPRPGKDVALHFHLDLDEEARKHVPEETEQWEEQVEAFALDPDFDYDIPPDKLTPKPRTPYG
eukprot:TRINITY_DN23774_c0_g1_i2.p1 TRINITY_DN23774_c0_g1~~TRINITY_DN23774_c0_g1_i2.p1  ORF type:complete len:454 (+),score=140.64 TRINITY_DN23774_c0_g1_i2:81-1442(+)